MNIFLALILLKCVSSYEILKIKSICGHDLKSCKIVKTPPSESYDVIPNDYEESSFSCLEQESVPSKKIVRYDKSICYIYVLYIGEGFKEYSFYVENAYMKISHYDQRYVILDMSKIIKRYNLHLPCTFFNIIFNFNEKYYEAFSKSIFVEDRGFKVKDVDITIHSFYNSLYTFISSINLKELGSFVESKKSILYQQRSIDENNLIEFYYKMDLSENPSENVSSYKNTLTKLVEISGLFDDPLENNNFCYKVLNYNSAVLDNDFYDNLNDLAKMIDAMLACYVKYESLKSNTSLVENVKKVPFKH